MIMYHIVIVLCIIHLIFFVDDKHYCKILKLSTKIGQTILILYVTKKVIPIKLRQLKKKKKRDKIIIIKQKENNNSLFGP